MRILADESCDRLVVMSLRDAGHDVVEGRQGDADLEVFRSASGQGRVLLTDDLDFGRLAEAASEHPPAVLLTRLYPLGRTVRARRVVQVISSLGDTVTGSPYCH
jgi:predicted nuclease of predicted toxin-antitoxin system